MFTVLTPDQAYKVLFLLALPVCLWAAISDLRTMKIPNKTVYALLAVFAIGGIMVIPLEFWLWRWLSFIVVFIITFGLYLVARLGAGDAKFAAAAAPFVSQNLAELQLVLILLAFFMLAALGLHRLARATPAIRRATPNWASWTSAGFPLGTALAATLMTYLAFKAFPSFYSLFAGIFASVSI
jgi:prepilin peptidase CpaA